MATVTETMLFMAFSLFRRTKPPQMTVFCGIAFQEHLILSRVESVTVGFTNPQLASANQDAERSSAV